MSLAIPIITIVTKFLDFLRVDKETKKEIFEISEDKKKTKAIDIAEKTYFLIDDKILPYLKDYLKTIEDKKDLQKVIRRYKYLKRVFFKFNQ